MKKHWKLLLSSLLLVGILALSACGTTDPVEDGPPGVAPPPVNGGVGDLPDPGLIAQPDRDLGGMNINIVQWWAEECTETAEPDSVAARARWDDRAEQEQRYNFRLRYYRFGSWGDVRDNVQPEILAGSRNYHVWIVEPSWFATHHGQRLFAPIPISFFEEHDDIEWVQAALELTMRDGNPHGWATGNAFSGGIYFNQRLFEEAGLDYDLPFTLQREGNWTWETFTDASRHLSRDIDGDGIIDTWAITSFNSDFLTRALASNNAAFAVVDPISGEFVNTTNTPQFLETIEWVVMLREEMLAMHEMDVGGEWDAFVQMFNDGQGAMRSAGHYVAGNLLLEDPWGFVHFPTGPRAVGGRTMDWVSHNIHVIPHFFSEQEVDDIMFAVSRWNRPIPDDDPDDWIFDNMVNHPDQRSVLETMMYHTRPPEFQVMPAHNIMPGIGDIIGTSFAWRVWVGNEPSVIVEEAQLVWGEFIARVNAIN